MAKESGSYSYQSHRYKQYSVGCCTAVVQCCSTNAIRTTSTQPKPIPLPATTNLQQPETRPRVPHPTTPSLLCPTNQTPATNALRTSPLVDEDAASSPPPPPPPPPELRSLESAESRSCCCCCAWLDSRESRSRSPPAPPALDDPTDEVDIRRPPLGDKPSVR